ncbi:MAG: acylneuraminate cytidylyltransferase family protein [Candidatus Omnitrophica bacterium]|nr:acylneuraminate cytidylyltransferase family protein [Candidatus Omnitrophota bacterium]
MSVGRRLLAVIPARGGSRGLPGKNIRLFAGLPLIGHAVRFAQMCLEITRSVVSTDDEEIARVARNCGAEVPFIRPSALSQDDTPLWPVVRHALAWVEEHEGEAYDLVLLLDPTSPAREPLDVSQAMERLRHAPEADGIIGVSQPDFNPIWHCVVERDGWMAHLIDSGRQFHRRQDVPTVYRINGSLYLWRAAFVRDQAAAWEAGRHLMYEIPESRAMSIDTIEEFEQAELLVTGGLIHLPWVQEDESRAR